MFGGMMRVLDGELGFIVFWVFNSFVWLIIEWCDFVINDFVVWLLFFFVFFNELMLFCEVFWNGINGCCKFFGSCGIYFF